MESGQRVAALRGALAGATIEAVAAVPGDRRLQIELVGPAGRVRVVAELFGRAGNWFVLDARGTILALARPVAGKARTLAPGGAYEPPRSVPPAQPPATTTGRFAPLAAAPLALSERIDRFFTDVDRHLVLAQELERVRERLRAAERRTRDRAEGLATRSAEAEGAGALRQDADLLLANLPLLRRGMTEVTLPDWFAEGGPERTIPLVAKLDGRQNAEALYDRARRLADSVEVTHAMLAEAEVRLRSLADLAERLARVASLDDLEALAPAIDALGLRPKQRAGQRTGERAGQAAAGRGRAATAWRTFTSLEGYPILVGRSAAGNEALTKRMARGNDLWLHAGGGIAGSHVVVRLPREKTASLETLLDAAHLAVHFSKARGRPACEVVYTQRKHVRKPKGLGTGQVAIDRSKSLHVRLDAERLARVLDTAKGSDEDLATPGGAG
jgi:predicted ribosome quality control (RQC) complex YloA/Tae2 family protein